uniref:Synaptobrevin, longin-like domain protein n=1 Tax=Tanacetum cinerariifolium TaxID=118510 RepID=A0A6L2NS51_TANCI|nr:hypothetical protein [Tanacetum cinerariifolium]
MANLTFVDTHNMVAFLSKSDACAGFDQIVDSLNTQVIHYDLMVNPTIHVSCINQFWATSSIKKANDVVKLRALIDGKRVVVSEDVVRQDIRLDDADGVECLPNEEIFTELARMGYEKPPLKLTFYKAFLSTQWKFLIHTIVQCISAKRTTWNEFSCSMASVICIATGRKFNFSKYIFDSMVRNVDSPSKFLMYPRFLQVLINNQVDDLSSHTTKHTSPELTQKVFANMRKIGKGFSRVETPLFATMLVQPQVVAEEEEDEEDETCITLSQKVTQLEQDKIAQVFWFKEVKKGGRIEAIDADEDITLVDAETQVDLGDELQGRKDDDNAAIKDASAAEPTVFDDEEVTMTMAHTLIKMKAERERLLDEQMAKRLHDEEVEQAAAKEKQDRDDMEKAKVLQKQYEDKQENIDWNTVAEQIQEKHLVNIRKYQSLKRKPISIAQAKKNMIIYLKNMAGYKMKHFKGMIYEKVRPIFEREYNKVQTLFKPDKDVEEPTTKRVAEETLLQESFKKLKAVEVSGSHSTQDTSTHDSKEMSEEDVKNILEIILVYKFKVEALQVKYTLIDWEIHFEGSRLVKEKFSSAVPTEDKEKALWVELKRFYEPNADDVLWKRQRYMHYPITWKLYSNCRVHQVTATTRRHDMFMLTEKNYPLSNGVMTLMLSAKLQLEEDSDMARDLVMKIFMEANKPKSRSLDTSSKCSR